VKKRKRLAASFAETVAELLPRTLEDAEKLTNETVQITVWLVGLAGSLVAIIIAKPDFVTRLSTTSQRAFLLLLLATIVFSVLHRLVLHISNRLLVYQTRQIQGQMLGFSIGFSDRGPRLLQSTWTREEIVRHLDTEFGLQYNFLNEHNSPLEMARQSYQAQWDHDQETEKKAFHSVQDALAASEGKPPIPQDAPAAGGTANEAREKVRIIAVAIKWVSYVASILFLLACLSFLAAATAAILAALPAAPQRATVPAAISARPVSR
jgi:lysylphosphatidylglycerol synthetase-like protein (DUF2156 family)